MTFDPTLNFTTKQQYLIWRLRWKEEFFRLLTAARQAKIDLKNEMRLYSKDKKRIVDLWSAHSKRKTTVAAIDEHLQILWRAKAEAAHQAQPRRGAAALVATRS